MNESLQIRKAGNMISTSVLSRIDPVDFVDTFCCRITAERDIRPAHVLITMFTNYPQWVEALMKLRNCLVEPFGLKGGKGPEVAEYHKIICFCNRASYGGECKRGHGFHFSAVS